MGSAPTCRTSVTRCWSRFTTDTVPSNELATYANGKVGWIATLLGSTPTGISAILRGVLFVASNTLIEFPSGFTLTRMRSLLESAIGLDCRGPLEVTAIVLDAVTNPRIVHARVKDCIDQNPCRRIGKLPSPYRLANSLL